MFCQIAPLTPLDTLVNRITKWTKLTHPPPPPTDHPNPNQPMEYQPRTMPAAQIPTPILLLYGWIIQTTQTNKQWTMETRKSWIWYLQPFQKPKNCKKITGSTKYSTSRNDGHTPHSTTPHHNIPKWASPHIHILSKHPIPPKHPNQTPHQS